MQKYRKMELRRQNPSRVPSSVPKQRTEILSSEWERQSTQVGSSQHDFHERVKSGVPNRFSTSLRTRNDRTGWHTQEIVE